MSRRLLVTSEFKDAHLHQPLCTLGCFIFAYAPDLGE